MTQRKDGDGQRGGSVTKPCMGEELGAKIHDKGMMKQSQHLPILTNNKPH